MNASTHLLAPLVQSAILRFMILSSEDGRLLNAAPARTPATRTGCPTAGSHCLSDCEWTCCGKKVLAQILAFGRKSDPCVCI